MPAEFLALLRFILDVAGKEPPLFAVFNLTCYTIAGFCFFKAERRRNENYCHS